MNALWSDPEKAVAGFTPIHIMALTTLKCRWPVACDAAWRGLPLDILWHTGKAGRILRPACGESLSLGRFGGGMMQDKEWARVEGAKLRARREALKPAYPRLSQGALADLVGTKQQVIERLENGGVVFSRWRGPVETALAGLERGKADGDRNVLAPGEFNGHFRDAAALLADRFVAAALRDEFIRATTAAMRSAAIRSIGDHN